MTAKRRLEPDDKRTPRVHDVGMLRMNSTFVDYAIIAVDFQVPPDAPNSTSTADVR